MTLDTPVRDLHRVGATLEKRLRTLGIATVRDLLHHFPSRYEDFSAIVPVAQLKDGMEATARGTITVIGNKRSHRRRMMITEAVIEDASGQMRVVWFNQPFIGKQLKAGDAIFVSGTAKEDMYGVSMASPAYEKERSETVHTGRIVPIYPLTAGITEKQIRFLVKEAVHLAKDIPEWLTDDIRATLLPLPDAMRAIHFPDSAEEQRAAERRLKFDELFILQLRAEMIRQSLARVAAPRIRFHEEETRRFVSALGFSLTRDQKVAAWEILGDMQKDAPMNRLLQGDVGSGKTAVAAIAAYNAALGGYQTAIMAPTEILAKQHYDTIARLLPKTITVGLLTSSEFRIENLEFRIETKGRRKKDFLRSLSNGQISVVIGTHALLTDAMQFKRLGLVIVDEQHRFGVEQRKLLREKSGLVYPAQPAGGVGPHFLSMSATPIPRSFALTMYGDLDLSAIRQMPPGRKPVLTRLVEPKNREKAYAFIREQAKTGRQAFVICPLIDASDGKEITKLRNDEIAGANDKKSVLAEFERLSKDVFPDLRVAYLHGKMKPKEKDAAMKNFAAGETDILVSTSVVEVGVNIPNASVMVIEGAERFGLAQLHQFRGRVGRAEHQSYCLLFTDTASSSARGRLAFFEKNTDGFLLAEYDLETRGPGEVYGTAQSGLMHLRLATMRDGDIIRMARDRARGIDFDAHPDLRRRVAEWERETHLE